MNSQLKKSNRMFKHIQILVYISMILRTDTSHFLSIMAIKHYSLTRLKFEKPVSHSFYIK